MPKRLRPERVTLALQHLGDWRRQVQAQGSAHLVPLLVLLEAGAGAAPGTEVTVNETPDEYVFWDRYLTLDDGDPLKPRFNPITLRRAEEGFPHSNSATVRKNTFAGKWRAATHEWRNDNEIWTLADNYAEIFRDKVLVKGGAITRIPVIDLAVLFLRGEMFADDADATSLREAFRERFRQRTSDFDTMFAFHPEAPEHLFQDAEPEPDYDPAILEALVDDVGAASDLGEATAAAGLDSDDEVLLEVQKFLHYGTSGIILTGVPGTGKSYYAREIARGLVQDPAADIFRVQFHPTYGYEDFVEGFRPNEQTKSGFDVTPKVFRLACERAEKLASDDRLVVMIIDEINRGDPARIFGEVLTYIESGYRGETFNLPFSGKPFNIPRNLLLLGTMNPDDRSIAPVDAAFVRRFDHVRISPSRERAEAFLTEASFAPEEVELIGVWFEALQGLVTGGIGHAFLKGLKNVDHLKLVWRSRIRPAAELAVELSGGSANDLDRSFEALIRRLEGAELDA